MAATETPQHQLVPALLAGAAAGLTVDVTLFPLDTVKTRLQSAQGFLAAGGFRGVYSGLASVALGSAPTAALFFLTYEGVKYISHRQLATQNSQWAPVVHMSAASVGEVAACLIRVPVEVVKQRAQAQQGLSSLAVLKWTLKREGFWGLYRGYASTVIREIPFSFIQFPIWEHLKMRWAGRQNKPVDPWQSAVCGAMSGCLSAGITTPLDVAKTRIMLAERGTVISKGNIGTSLQIIFQERGVKGLFSGILPRMLWISIGGAVFLGVYDKVKKTIVDKLYVEDKNATDR